MSKLIQICWQVAFDSPYHEPRSTDIVFGRPRRRTSFTQIVSQINVTTYELVKPITNSVLKMKCRLKIGEVRFGHAQFRVPYLSVIICIPKSMFQMGGDGRMFEQNLKIESKALLSNPQISGSFFLRENCLPNEWQNGEAK
ncbi:hypothetical protein EVAR_95017_1 [Eumeta japonica]|uniref:Uncharacterized protein n=1 Tax=Eumeta variegata TaxID=151549 RepID=A0A4C1VSD2_EUMVA|nr:hypothetical protein EVAR_95017_1 [Eumeta japonica]